MGRFFEKAFVIAMAVVTVAGLIGVLGYATYLEVNPPSPLPPHPSDEEMIRGFREHREQFEELRELCQGNERFGLRYDRLRENNSTRELSSADTEDPVFGRYLDLHKELGVRVLRSYGPGGRVVIITSTRGLSISGTGKGYVYSERPSRPVVRDTEKDAAESMGETYRHIEGRWYLTNHWDT